MFPALQCAASLSSSLPHTGICMTGHEPVPILLVNDRAEDLTALEAALTSLDEVILTASSAREALRIVREREIAVAILDIRMPDIDGFQLAEQLRASEPTRNLPLIFVSATDVTPELLDRVYALGAVDFLSSPVAAKVLRAKVAVFVELHRKNVALQRRARDIAAVADATISEQQERMHLLLEAASDYALFFTDPEGTIREWTTSAEHLLGFTETEIVGRHISIIFTAADRLADAPALEMQNAVLEGQSRDERWHLRKNQSVFFAVGRLVALRRKDGTIRGFAKILRDSTQQKAAEQLLRESEQQFRTVFDLAAVAHVIIDPRTKRFLRVNARFCALTGYSAEELQSRTFADITHPDDRAAGHGQFADLWDGKVNEINTEKRYLHKDGRTIWAQVTATLLRNADGAPWLHISVIQDITARRHAEQQLAESQTQLRLALEAAELGTFFHDLSRNRLVHNERATHLLGLPRGAEVSTEIFLACIHPDDRERVKSTLAARRAVSGNREDLKLEYRVVWPDRSIHHLAAASRAIVHPQADGSTVVHIVGTLRDVTATKEFEQELRNKVAERTAALQEKTAQLESFCYTVAHDLRSPLRAISGYADIVLQDFGGTLPAAGNDYMKKIKASATRLDALIRDLLAYSRITQVDIVLDDVSVQSSVDWALQQLRPEIVSKHAVVNVVPPLPKVRGERTVLDQVVLNLVSNALKFVRPGTAPQVEISSTQKDGLVRLFVRDNGIGIAENYHDRIFRVFERLQQARDFPGTGVGLAIVAKAAERLGGRVGVESQPDQGSTFWIELKKAES